MTWFKPRSGGYAARKPASEYATWTTQRRLVNVDQFTFTLREARLLVRLAAQIDPAQVTVTGDSSIEEFTALIYKARAADNRPFRFTES